MYTPPTSAHRCTVHGRPPGLVIGSFLNVVIHRVPLGGLSGLAGFPLPRLRIPRAGEAQRARAGLAGPAGPLQELQRPDPLRGIRWSNSSPGRCSYSSPSGSASPPSSRLPLPRGDRRGARGHRPRRQAAARRDRAALVPGGRRPARSRRRRRRRLDRGVPRPGRRRRPGRLLPLLALLKPGGMGLGDVKLAGLLGLYLGVLGWDTLAVGGFGAFLLGGAAAAGCCWPAGPDAGPLCRSDPSCSPPRCSRCSSRPRSPSGTSHCCTPQRSDPAPSSPFLPRPPKEIRPWQLPSTSASTSARSSVRAVRPPAARAGGGQRLRPGRTCRSAPSAPADPRRGGGRPAIKTIWAEKEFRSKNVILGVSSHQAVVREISLPELPARRPARRTPQLVPDCCRWPPKGAARLLPARRGPAVPAAAGCSSPRRATRSPRPSRSSSRPG